MSQTPLVVLAAGGTGGHVFPAEALAVELKNRGCRLALITDRRGGYYNGGLSDVETHRIQAGGVAGKGMLARMKSLPELAFGTLQARSLLRKLKPAVVVGFGGYASFPTLMAATIAGFPTVIHEQNAILGRANRLLASRVDRIATSFERSRGLPEESNGKVVCTGMPVRSAIVAKRGTPYPPLREDSPINVMVMGGSQGARVFSEVLPSALVKLDPRWRERLAMTQQCRPEDLETVRQSYVGLGIKADLSSFFSDIPERLAAAHLLIGRSGASTVAEITAIGRPAIMVPYPYAVDDHQTANAHAIDEEGGGWLMPEQSFTPDSLVERLNALFGYPTALENAAACSLAIGRPEAAQTFADVVCNVMHSNGNDKNGSIGRQAA
ncbi:MAG: undecaprenyldiphospho-muramoylpentapeptide beta-N-acetylglucosaminyltransferase [Rhodospirillales bacterium]|jgi:UDP-N-acetylglucosamine--N-acetylmuramyl-(pentapeptide) pyrophosphoryl-undecaprenol N-acetylglucosamine transferase